jgi:hypothetical protein
MSYDSWKTGGGAPGITDADDEAEAEARHIEELEEEEGNIEDPGDLEIPASI